MQLEEQITRAIRAHFPGRSVESIKDRGAWVRHIVEVTLDGGEVVFFKIDLHDGDEDWLPSQEGECHERDVSQILEAHGLSGIVPSILVVDHTREFLPHPYIIQTHVGGVKLGTLLDQVSEVDAEAIYETLGWLYRKLHAIHNDTPGIWNGSTPGKPWGDPTNYMYNAEIFEGSGKRALEQGRISQRTYDRVVAVWGEHLGLLKDFTPSLVHYSAFLWSIYLEKRAGVWQVTKLTSLGDVMWWEAAYDLACLRYPPFGDLQNVSIGEARWRAFLRGYGAPSSHGRMLFYVILQWLCAAMGSYWEPRTPHNQAWAEQALGYLDTYLDDLERAF